MLLVVLGGGLSGCAPEQSAPDEQTRSGRARSSGEEQSVHHQEMSGTKSTRVKIFAEKPFYLARPEPEQGWTGMLRRVPVLPGPNTRDLPYHLETSREVLRIYAAGPEEALLKPFVDRPVEVVGKRIDLQAEGFSIELWPGSITSYDN
jgi:hypothetical protein